MNIGEKTNKAGDKTYFFYDLGRGAGQRPSTGIFIYTRPKNQEQKNFNKEALKILETKKSQLTIEQQAIGTPIIPAHKFKTNFVEYFQDFIALNKREGNRHLVYCLSKFKTFIKRDSIAPVDITENFCKRFRQYLLDTLTGETPANYYARFKWVVKAATKDGYYRINPTEDIPALKNASIALKEHLEAEEYISLLNTPCFNQQVKLAFLFSCYTGLRWVDVKRLEWKDIQGAILITRIIQKKTGKPVTLTLHPISLAILEEMKRLSLGKYIANNKVFALPTANGANKVLDEWVNRAKIDKNITWSCARLSFSILLKDKNVDDVTIAYLMGHTTTRQVQQTYKRHKPKDQSEAISHLPYSDITSFV
ncbi:Integrase [Chitinophaga sp. CF118]|uniref:site-specific integrase n=1 Tax=Chitinophaga sp. CF118 TaxID=1884367 RepID=UPI0008F0102C|nr:site-specific integrase [Chitinophaga sp. CF118]SFE40516.1 Integrase [Chitinophaga sp. CF118]